jgi:hypothetical protein
VWLDGVHSSGGSRGRHRECEEADVGTDVHDDFAAASQLLEHPEQVGIPGAGQVELSPDQV